MGGGASGACLEEGTAQGQLVQWDAAQECYVPVAAPTVLGQRPFWDTVTGEWLARDGSGFSQVWGNLNFGNLASGFLNTGTHESGGTNAIATSNAPLAGAVLLTRIAAMGNSAAPPSSCTWTIFINGVSSGVTLVQVPAGPVEAVISLAVSALSFIAIQWTLAGATDATTRRPRVTVRGQSNS